MNFKERELTFGFKDRSHFDAEGVKSALENEKFPNVELLSGPAEGLKKE
jgi:hypothetical protein